MKLTNLMKIWICDPEWAIYFNSFCFRYVGYRYQSGIVSALSTPLTSELIWQHVCAIDHARCFLRVDVKYLLSTHFSCPAHDESSRNFLFIFPRAWRASHWYSQQNSADSAGNFTVFEFGYSVYLTIYLHFSDAIRRAFVFVGEIAKKVVNKEFDLVTQKVSL